MDMELDMKGWKGGFGVWGGYLWGVVGQVVLL